MKLIAHKMNTTRLDALPLINAASLLSLPARYPGPAWRSSPVWVLSPRLDAFQQRVYQLGNVRHKGQAPF
jgi:hypothetical protein